MTRPVAWADCRRQFTYSARCRECRRNVGEAHADDCPRVQPPAPTTRET